MKIAIPNFAKYNPRDDVKNPSWVRLERDWWVDMFSWSADAQRLWFMIMGLAKLKPLETDVTDALRARDVDVTDAGKGVGIANLDPEFAAANLRLPVASVQAAIDLLESKKRIVIVCLASALRARDVDVTDAGVTDGTNGTGRTDERLSPREPAEPAAAPLPTAKAGRPLDFTDGDMKAAAWLQRQILLLNPLAVTAKKAKLDKWANEIRLMRDADGITHQRLAEVLTWALEDPFWRPLIRSPEYVRKKWDTLSGQMLSPRKSGFAAGGH